MTTAIPALYRVENINELKYNDPIANLVGPFEFCRVGKVPMIESSIYDIYFKYWHIKQLGFEFCGHNNVSSFWIPSEPSIKLLPNVADCVEFDAHQFIVFYDFDEIQNISSLSGDEIIAKYNTLGSLRSLLSLYESTDCYKNLDSRISQLLVSLNSQFT